MRCDRYNCNDHKLLMCQVNEKWVHTLGRVLVKYDIQYFLASFDNILMDLPVF